MLSCITKHSDFLTPCLQQVQSEDFLQQECRTECLAPERAESNERDKTASYELTVLSRSRDDAEILA